MTTGRDRRFCDIRAAEQTLIAANAEIGVARAAYFPQLSLSGVVGGESTQLTSLFSGAASTWSFVPQISQPIFTAGKLKSGVKQAEAQQESALMQYEKTIQTAFYEVSNSLIAHQRARESRQKHEELVIALQDVWPTSVIAALTRSSTRSMQNRDLFQAELTLAQIRLDELLTVGQLHKAHWVADGNKRIPSFAPTVRRFESLRTHNNASEVCSCSIPVFLRGNEAGARLSQP